LTDLGYNYDSELSSPEAKVFTDHSGKPHIAFRGSQRIKDDWLGADVKLLFGLEKYDRRFQEAKHLTKLVEDKYNRGADVFGHSLGGSLAEKSGARGQIVTYNNGAGIFDIGRKLGDNQTDIRRQNDVVSLLGVTQRGGQRKTERTSHHKYNVFGNHKFS
jgi:hypothetical protein